MRPPGNAFAPLEVAAHSPSAPIGLPRAEGARNRASTPHRCVGHADDRVRQHERGVLGIADKTASLITGDRISADLTIAEPFGKEVLIAAVGSWSGGRLSMRPVSVSDGSNSAPSILGIKELLP